MPIIGTLASGGLAPGAPIIGTATGLDSSATVAFTAPAWVGKGTGTVTYTATSSPGNITGTSTTSPITVNGLTNGTAYTFTVTATTSYGITGPASAASNSVTPAALGVFQRIATASPSGTDTVLFTNIPQTFTYLQIHGVIYSGSSSDVVLRFNNISSNQYGNHWFEANCSGNIVNGVDIWSGGNDINTQSGIVMTTNFRTGTTTTTPYMTSIYIGGYANQVRRKTIMANYGRMDAPNAVGRVGNTTGQWNSYSAVTSISLICTGNYATGSTLTLYGVGV